MPIDTWFPTLVYRAVLDDAGAAVNQRLLPYVDEVCRATPDNGPLDGLMDCAVYTTFATHSELHRNEAFAEIVRGLMHHVRIFADNLAVDLKNWQPRITRMWLNRYALGDYQEFHTHPGSHLSGTYYISAPPGSGALVFASPLGRRRSSATSLCACCAPQHTQATLQPATGRTPSVSQLATSRRAAPPNRGTADKLSVQPAIRAHRRWDQVMTLRQQTCFASPLWLAKLPLGQVVIDRLVAEVYRLREADADGAMKSSTGGGWQSSRDQHTNVNFSDVCDFIAGAADSLRRSLMHPMTTTRFEGCWANVNPPGSSNLPHIHPGSHISGALYLRIGPEAGALTLYDIRVFGHR